jgi:hypothetical protein
MTEAELIVQEIQHALPSLKRGTMRFWGQWFGSPYDNIHSIVDCNADGDLLRIVFNEGEMLLVSKPRDASVSDKVYRIRL